ncbi:hypothetical protein KC331_g14438 [Hortaea werneckii]|nr:hypothetical protein KC331_g14438 [Hortaea werneckii]KAI7703890.1 hypothetical protein KC353_g13818 [Hortaea werneckii]
MRSTQAYHDDEYLREVWILYGIGVLIYFLRFCVRLRTVGIRHFQGDDWTSIAVLLCYTADAVTVTFTYLLGSNVDWPPEKLDQFNAQQIDNIILGSKLQLVAWYTYTALIWGLKACMLFFFNRLTFGLNVQTYVKILAIACGATYIAVFLTISVGCHPIQKNWAVDPYPPAECTLRSQNMYVTTVLNVITDAAMLCIPHRGWKSQSTRRTTCALRLLEPSLSWRENQIPQGIAALDCFKDDFGIAGTMKVNTETVLP